MTLERPIAYSPPMVTARRNGKKRQTRREIRGNPNWGDTPRPCSRTTIEGFQGGVDYSLWSQGGTDTPDEDPRRCPYGEPGDRLWVKEEHWLFGLWHVDGRTATGKPKWRFEYDQSMGVQFDTPSSYVTGRSTTAPAWHKRIGMFMPRWASRGLDEVVSVRPERLQDISTADAISEGLLGVQSIAFPHLLAWCDYANPDDIFEYFADPIASYQSLWTSLNGAESWASNPLVWRVEFKVITP